jgi:photosystem II stability/assembly factor-like uncharacterized protein
MLYQRHSRLIFLLLLAVVGGVLAPETRGGARWDPLYEPGCGGWMVAVEVSPFDPKTMVLCGDILGVGVTHDGGQFWTPSTGFTHGWEIGDATFHPTDPNVIWIGTLMGPHKSIDGGKTFVLKREGFPPSDKFHHSAPIQRICFDPNNSNTLLAFGGSHRHMTNAGPNTHNGAVWKSTDGGESWKLLSTIDDAAIGSSTDGRGVNIMNAGFAGGSSAILYAASDEGGVYKSTDGGTNFLPVNNGLPTKKVCFIAIHSKNPDIVWASLEDGHGVYKTTDGGATWKSSSVGMDDLKPTQELRTIAVCQSDPNVLYTCGFRYQDPCSIYRTADGGDHWTKAVDNGRIANRTAYSERICASWLSVDPNDPRHILALTQETAVQSLDAGQTWNDVTSHRENGAWRGNGYGGECGTIIKWNPYRLGQVFTLAMDGGKILHSDDCFWTWKIHDPKLPPYNGGNDVAFARDGTIYDAFGQKTGNRYEPLGISKDGGNTWQYAAVPAGAKGYNRGVYTLPDDSRQVWIVVNNGAYRSADGGATWSAIELKDGGVLSSIANDPTQPMTLYIGAEKGVYKTTDGEHFERMPGSPSGQLWNNVLLDPTDPGVIYSTSFHTGGQGVFRFRDGKWTRILAKPTVRMLAVDPADPKRLAVITKDWPGKDQTLADGVWISEDDGNTWSQCNDGICVINGSAIAFNPDKSSQLILGSDGGGFYVTDLGPPSSKRAGDAKDIVAAIETKHFIDSGPGTMRQPLPAGQWMKYKVNVPTTGYYNLKLRAASAAKGAIPNAAVHIEFNGVNVTGPVLLGATGGADGWTDKTVPHIRLIGGDQYMKLFLESSGASVDSIEVTSSKP